MKTTIRIPWTRDFDNEYMWNEVCCWAIERFGLPGDRFETHANVNYMEFIFVNKNDAMMFALMWNGTFISDNDLTVEAVGRLL